MESSRRTWLGAYFRKLRRSACSRRPASARPAARRSRVVFKLNSCRGRPLNANGERCRCSAGFQEPAYNSSMMSSQPLERFRAVTAGLKSKQCCGHSDVQHDRMRKGVGGFLTILGGYTALALFLAAANYLTYLSTSGTAYWAPTLKRSLGEWYAWAALTPLILYLARRWPIERGAFVRNGAIHVAAMVAIGVFKLFLDQRIRILLFGSAGYLLFTNLAFNFLIYGAIV